jgi:hypothetical protein
MAAHSGQWNEGNIGETNVAHVPMRDFRPTRDHSYAGASG